MAGVKGAPVPKVKPYVHEEYPKVLYAKNEEGKIVQVVVNDAGHAERFLAKSTREWSDTPADFLPKSDHDDLSEAAEEVVGDAGEAAEQLVGGSAAAAKAAAGKQKGVKKPGKEVVEP